MFLIILLEIQQLLKESMRNRYLVSQNMEDQWIPTQHLEDLNVSVCMCGFSVSVCLAVCHIVSMVMFVSLCQYDIPLLLIIIIIIIIIL